MIPLVLYDIPSKLPGKAWTPNPTKPRFVLGYKNLPFETVWVEFPDIAPLLKEIGASPTKRLDGSDRYTLPVLRDPNTGALVSDSWDIAVYLDKTYPEKPIFPKCSEGLIRAFESAVVALHGDGTSQRFSFLRSQQILNGRSSDYFTVPKEARIGVKIGDGSPEKDGGSKYDTDWTIIENNFLGSAKMWYEKVEGKWVMGDAFSYADIVFGAHLFWLKRVYRDDEWKRVASFHEGKWEKLLTDVEKECNFILNID